MASTTSAADHLTELLAERDAARRRIREIEDQQREAHAAVAQAAMEVAALEREGGSASQRNRVKAKLSAAKQRQESEPWAERRAGAQARATDVDRRVAEFTYANLAELVAVEMQRGDVLARELNESAERVATLFVELEGVAGAIGALIGLAGIRARPGDVSRLPQPAQELFNAASAMRTAGGLADGPHLTRDPRPAPEPVEDDVVAGVPA